MSPAVLRVALDMPLRRLFDYLPPASGGPDRARVSGCACPSGASGSWVS